MQQQLVLNRLYTATASAADTEVCCRHCYDRNLYAIRSLLLIMTQDDTQR